MKTTYCHYFFLFSLIIFTIRCSNNKEEDIGNNGEDNNISNEDQTFVIADTSYMIGESKNGIIYFTNNTPDGKLPQKGNIICASISSHTPYGLLGKVKNITRNNKQVAIETESVPLDEAFQNLKIDTTFNINDYITEIISPDGETYDLKRVSHIDSKSGASVLALSFNIPPNKFQFYGDIKLNISCDFRLNILNGFKDLKMIVRPECIFSSGIKMDKKLKQTYPLGEIKFKPIPIGYVVIIPVLKPTLVCGADAEAKVDIAINYTISGEYGLTYDGNEWYEINETYPSKTYFTANSELNLSGSLYAGLDMSIGLGFYHPTVSLGTNIGFRLKIQGENIDFINPDLFKINPSLLVSAGVEGNMFTEIKIFSLKILSNYSPTFEKYFPIWKRYLFPSYSDIAVELQNKNVYFNYEMTSPPLFSMYHGYAIFKDDKVISTRYHLHSLTQNSQTANYNGSYENLPEGVYYISPICKVFGKEFYGKKTSFEIKKNILEWMDHNIGYYTFSAAQSACPIGYRLPTSDELRELIKNTMTRTGGWSATSPGVLHIQLSEDHELHLPAGEDGSTGIYWSSTSGGVAGYYLNFTNSDAYVTKSIFLGDQGMTAAVRCVKE